jgi:hypothetical protein
LNSLLQEKKEVMPIKTIPALYRSIHESLWQRIPDNYESRFDDGDFSEAI